MTLKSDMYYIYEYNNAHILTKTFLENDEVWAKDIEVVKENDGVCIFDGSWEIQKVLDKKNISIIKEGTKIDLAEYFI